VAAFFRSRSSQIRDLQRTIALLSRAGALGDAMSMNLLGWLHLSTARGREDFEASMRWFAMAGPAGDPEGLYQIGRARLLAATDAEERGRALSVLRDAAARGSIRAQDALTQAGEN
jgi:TPR repeat protein